MNNNYFGPPISQEQLQRQLAARRRGQHRQSSDMSMLDTGAQQQSSHGDHMSGMNDNPMVGGGDSIDDMLRDSSNDVRRRSVPQPQQMMGQLSQDGSVDNRRVSMLDFGSGVNDYGNFQFGNMGAGGGNGGFDGMVNMGINTSTFTPSSMMSMAEHDFTTLSPDMMGNMMAFSNLNMNNMQDPTGMGLFGGQINSQFNSPLNTVNTDFSMDMNQNNDPLSAVGADITASLNVKSDHDMMGVDQVFDGSDDSNTPGRTQDLKTEHQSQQPPPTPLSRGLSDSTSFATPMTATSQPATQATAPPSAPTTQTTPAMPTPAAAGTPPAADLRKPDVYSKTGFDMLRALWYVATRKDPKVRLGAVDMSCAFVVCDATLNDCPIVYVSDNFQNLTGYSRHEIVGQNCRFLQAPDGKVEAGTKREFVENGAVFNLKQSIEQGKEIQQSLINYRKGGKPFLNLLTMIPIPWDIPEEIRFFIGFQIDLVECPDALTGKENGGMEINYKHSDIGQYIWTPPTTNQWEPDSGQTLNTDDVSALLQVTNPKAVVSDWHKQSWDKMLLENTDDVVHVLSLKGLFLYLSPSAKKILEWDAADLVGNPISSICHPSDIVPVTRELKDTTAGSTVNLVFRIRRKQSGYTWFESHGSLFVEQGKGRKCIILVGRKRPVFALQRRDLEANGGIGDSEIWTKLSTSGMFLFVSSNVRSLLDLLPETLQGTSIQDLMRKESRAEFGRSIEKARRGRIVTCKHEVQNKRGQVLQAMTVLYPGDAAEGSKPSFLLAQTKLIKASSRALAPATSTNKPASLSGDTGPRSPISQFPPTTSTILPPPPPQPQVGGTVILPANAASHLGHQDAALAADDNIFDELKTTRCTSWQYELRQMEKVNRLLAEELAQLLSNKKKRKRRKGGGNMVRDCANCHTRNTPEWRRGPSGMRDLCNSCGLRWAKQTGRVSPRNSSRGGNGDSASKKSASPIHPSSLAREVSANSNNNNNSSSSTERGNSQSKSRSPITPPSGLQQQGGNSGNTSSSSGSGGNGGGGNGNGGGGQGDRGGEGFDAGAGNHGHQMSSIREERETSA
ncbi:PAS domain-containing protein [Coniochaeta sp. 2T2.1]|nr:PAS domain-containing protein [Coniochaeta sp. 2T2.1]